MALFFDNYDHCNIEAMALFFDNYDHCNIEAMALFMIIMIIVIQKLWLYL
jgi:hypothetical protein